uniref:Uncharacterized protein n=1 Tax=Poecilia formosa TaxID=48698 RepID=A0A096M318_POEFO
VLGDGTGTGAHVRPVGEVGLGLGVHHQHPLPGQSFRPDGVRPLGDFGPQRLHRSLVLVRQTHDFNKLCSMFCHFMSVKNYKKTLHKTRETRKMILKMNKVPVNHKHDELIITGVFFTSVSECVPPVRNIYRQTTNSIENIGNFKNGETFLTNPPVALYVVNMVEFTSKPLMSLPLNGFYGILDFLKAKRKNPNGGKLLADCLTIVIASKMGSGFTPEIQATFQKFLAVVVSALGKQYH